MVLILSAQDDYSTNDVIDWLRYYGVEFLRISYDDLIVYEEFSLSAYDFNLIFSINRVKYSLKDFKAFWYRRSHYNFHKNIVEGNSKLIKQINNHLNVEINEIHKFFLEYISTKSINNYSDLQINKLSVLKFARDLKLTIPETIITTSKEEVIKFKEKFGEIITKNFSQGIFIYLKNMIFNSITNIVSDDMIINLPDNFYPTLFQKKIDKLFELRIVYLNGSFFSSAIFSQNDHKTMVDFRNYNTKRPNRTPPFKLPDLIEEKLSSLMIQLKLNSGSIDMLISDKNEYVFLEVNPIGQFAQVSYPCNLKIEKAFVLELKKIIDEN